MMIAINIEAFMPKAFFYDRIQEMIKQVTSSKKRPGVSKINVPGEHKLELKRKRDKEGIPISPVTIKDLQSLAKSKGVPFRREG